MSVLTFREDTLLWRSDKDLRDGIQYQEEQGFEGSEGVGEVNEGSDEDEDI